MEKERKTLLFDLYLYLEGSSILLRNIDELNKGKLILNLSFCVYKSRKKKNIRVVPILSNSLLNSM